MSYLTLNGALLTKATIRIPLVGAWVADVEHMTEPEVGVGDAVSLVFGGQTFVGTVHRVQSGFGSGYDARIVGGSGGLSTVLDPEQYMSPTVGQVLRDAVSDAGETLSGTISADTLATPLRAWARRSQTLGEALDSLSGLLGLRWRVLLDGTIWLGSDPGTAAALTDYEMISEDAGGCVIIAAEEPTILPGEAFVDSFFGLSFTVGEVRHVVDELKVRTELLSTEAIGRGASMLDALIRRAAPRDLYACYEYEVISQTGDLLELRSQDARLPGLSKVPYRPATPGMSYTVPAGARCLVGFRDGSPQQPYIASWVSGTPSTVSMPVSSLIHLGATTGADFVALAALVEAELSTLKAAINGAAVVAGDGGAAFKANLILALAGWPGSVGASRVKAT